MEDFSCEHLDRFVEDTGGDIAPVWDFKRPMEYTIDMLNSAREKWLEYDRKIKGLEFSGDESIFSLKEKQKNIWWQMIQLLPSSYNQTRNVMLNYEVLANIYKSRRNHKLNEWRDFCKFIEELPYSELICGEVDIMTPNEQREKLEEVADKFCEIGNINPLSKEEIEQAVNLFRMKEN